MARSLSNFGAVLVSERPVSQRDTADFDTPSLSAICSIVSPEKSLAALILSFRCDAIRVPPGFISFNSPIVSVTDRLEKSAVLDTVGISQNPGV